MLTFALDTLPFATLLLGGVDCAVSPHDATRTPHRPDDSSEGVQDDHQRNAPAHKHHEIGIGPRMGTAWDAEHQDRVVVVITPAEEGW